MKSILNQRKAELDEVLAEKNRIQLENNKLLAQQEQLTKLVHQTIDEVEERTLKMKILDNELIQFKDLMTDFVDKSYALMAVHTRTLAEAKEVFQKYIMVIKELDNHLVYQSEMLADLKQQQLLTHQTTVNELERFDKVKTDLDIYKKRLERFILESGSTIKIIV